MVLLQATIHTDSNLSNSVCFPGKIKDTHALGHYWLEEMHRMLERVQLLFLF
jgi:hypothetical protein